MRKKKIETRPYIVKGTIELRGYFFVDAESPEDAMAQVEKNPSGFDFTNYETINWEPEEEGELNE